MGKITVEIENEDGIKVEGELDLSTILTSDLIEEVEDRIFESEVQEFIGEHAEKEDEPEEQVYERYLSLDAEGVDDQMKHDLYAENHHRANSTQLLAFFNSLPL